MFIHDIYDPNSNLASILVRYFFAIAAIDNYKYVKPSTVYLNRLSQFMRFNLVPDV